MTAHRDPDEMIHAFLLEGEEQLHDQVYDRVRAAIEQRRQRVSIGPWRSASMTSYLRVAAVIGVVAVSLTALLALSPRFGIGVRPTPTVAPITGSLPAARTAVIAQHAAALNDRDVEAFVDLFAPDGDLDPRGTFAASSTLFANNLPLADRFLLEPFMAINEAWAFEVEVVSCDRLSRAEYAARYTIHRDDVEEFVHCAVRSRWHRLSLEIGEWWNYELSGTEILWWGQRVRDAAPTDRALPLGLDGLLEWEAWLESTDPDLAARLLNPREFPVTVPCGGQPDPPCRSSSENVDVERITSWQGYGGGRNDWIVAGQRFHPGPLIPYDPALAAEIEASIEEYLGAVDGEPTTLLTEQP